MQTLSCAGCGADLDDEALYCPECGLVPRDDQPAEPEVVPASAAPAPPPARPAAPPAPPSPRAVRNLRIAQGVALFLCLAAGYASAVARSDLDPSLVHAGQVGEWGAYISVALGSAIKDLGLGLLAGFFFLGWFRKTRKLVPFLAAVITVAGAASQRDARDERNRDYESVVNALVITRRHVADYVPADSATEPQPGERGVNARIEYAERRYLTRLADLERDVREQNHLAVTDPPAAWKNGEYLAHPRAHPEVLRYWRQVATEAGHMREALTRYGNRERPHVEIEAGLAPVPDVWRTERFRAFEVVAGPYVRQLALARAAQDLYDRPPAKEHADSGDGALDRITAITRTARQDSAFWEARRSTEWECDAVTATCTRTPDGASP